MMPTTGFNLFSHDSPSRRRLEDEWLSEEQATEAAKSGRSVAVGALDQRGKQAISEALYGVQARPKQGRKWKASSST